jgi:uncharacterized repeat protein (TIGR01451 family)
MNFSKPAFLLAAFFFVCGNAVAAKQVVDINGRLVSFGSAIPVRATARRIKSTSVRPRSASTVTVNAGPDTDAANNDYRRIQNALNAAASGDTIRLSGTFDFTSPFAAAAWAAGNDGVAGNADDYEVLVPSGVNNLTITATSLGSATIQGPGDLPAIDLEAFLVFDSQNFPGGNQSCTISNLQIFDFDLSIGMFAVTSNDYNGTTITNNVIRIATDLNATVAPADVLQNIGINYSFGTNQTITNNTFNIPGDGVSDSSSGNFSSTVAMQSTAGVLLTYTGLNISGNVIHTLNAQSADPQKTLGIWENGHAHGSNITIANNSFLNDDPGNDPTLNIERAFRVTSHSSAGSTVTYSGNFISGANIGFEWMAGTDFIGSEGVAGPVVLTSNRIQFCNTGVLVQSNGIAHLETDTIVASVDAGVHVVSGRLSGFGADPNGIENSYASNGPGDGVRIEATAGTIAPFLHNAFNNDSNLGVNNLSATPITATANWWGGNHTAVVAAATNGIASVLYDPWLATPTDTNLISPGFQPFIYATTTTAGNLTTLAGTSAADTGSMIVTPGPPTVRFTMDGDTALDPLAEMLNVSIQLGNSDDVFTLGQTSIPTTFDGGGGNDTLIGTNVAQTWNITGANSGDIPGATSAFQNVESLTGGSAADNFVFGSAGSIARKLDGGLGTDTLDNSAVPGHSVNPSGPGTLDGFMGTATGVGTTFDNINIVAAAADVSVTKTGPATASAGSLISYAITVTNNGPNPAINATLSDVIPAGTTFASFTGTAGWNCTTPPVNGSGSVTCTIPSMGTGSAVFTLNVNGPAAPATVSNTATVSSSSIDNTPGNNSATVMTNVINTADLSITKTATATAAQGTNINYNITLTNNGPNPATSVSLTDALPANTTFVSTAQNTGPAFSCTNPSVGTNGTVTCTNASLASGATATFTIVANVSASAPLGTLNNTANVTTTSTDPTTPNTSTAGTVITAGNADLGIVKTAAPGPYSTGNNLTYTIAVTNGGPSSAATVNVTDTLPAGTTLVSATPTQGSCTGTATVICSLGTIANAGTASIALTITLPSTPGPVSNLATVASPTNPDSNGANNSSTATVTVIPAGNIPAMSSMMLLLLAMTLAMGGLMVRKG